jgi:hypothetical protein
MKKYVWCTECHRVYLLKQWVRNELRCPNERCGAGMLKMEGCKKYMYVPWDRVRERMKEEEKVVYPVEPVVGERYSLWIGGTEQAGNEKREAKRKRVLL